MSATVISTREWFDAYLSSVSPQLDRIHPSAAHFCHDCLIEMGYAVAQGNNDRLSYLLNVMQDKITDELEWEEDKQRSVDEPGYVPRCMR